MNPFDLNSKFNPFIYENISGINKDIEKQVMASFENLIESDDKDLSPDNAMIFSGMKKHLISNSCVIRNMACDLLYKFYTNKKKCENLNELTALWLFKFLEKPEYKTGIMIYKKCLNFQDIEKHFIDLFDFENELNLSLIGFLFALKNTSGENEKLCKYRNWFIENMDMISFNSNLILNRIQRILEYLGPIDRVKQKVRRIIAPSLMNSKWSILLKIFNEVPSDISRDSKYLSTDLLADIVSLMDHTDDLEIRTRESLYVVFPKVKYKTEYLSKVLAKINNRNICYKRLNVSLCLLDQNIDFEIVNEMLLSTMKIHNCTKPDVECLQYIENDIELVKIIDMKRYQKDYELESDLAQLKIENTNCPCEYIGLTVYRELYDSFKYLNEVQIIQRASLFTISLNPQYFEPVSIFSDIKSSLEVFPKEIFFVEDFDYDNTLVILRYPNDFEPNIVKTVIDKDFRPFIDLLQFKDIIIEFLNAQDESNLFEIYKSMNFPKEYDLFFYYKFENIKLRFIDYEELLNFYLDGDFIKKLFSHPIFSRKALCDEVIKYVSSYDIPITTEYSSEFYDRLPQFFDNVKLRLRLRELEEIKKIYQNNANTNEEKLLMLCVDEILNCNDFECVVSDRNISLGKNQVFLEKVCKDLNIESNFELPNAEIKTYLKINEKRTIDYLIRSHLFDITSLRFIDFSYLSNKALEIVVERLCEILEVDSNSDYHSLDDSSTNEEEVSLEKYLIVIDNNNRFVELSDILEMIEGDNLLENEFYEERSKIYSPLFSSILQILSNNIINNFSLSKIEDSIDQDELFDFILSGFPTKKHLYWEFLLGSLSIIRNHEIVIFIEEMLSKKNDIKLENMNESLQQLFAFTFPNLYSKIARKKFNLENYIYQEACNKIENTNVKFNKTSVDYTLKIIYNHDLNEFTGYIKFPFNYPFKRPVFITNVEKNSLLNLKIAELIRKTSKFMSVMNLWKVNIDKKADGVKECLFCYFIVHTSDGSFPEYTCVHCSNKFHTKCIDRWIKTYNKRTCPLCRQLIPIY